jgi:hypothetical protein
LEILKAVFPIVGNFLHQFSNRWKFFERFFQPLETDETAVAVSSLAGGGGVSTTEGQPQAGPPVVETAPPPETRGQ